MTAVCEGPVADGVEERVERVVISIVCHIRREGVAKRYP